MVRKLLSIGAAAAAGSLFLLRGASGRRAVDVAVEEIRDDVRAVKQRDPAATSTIEILTSYSGLHALWLHRLAHRLHGMGLHLLSRWVSQFNRMLTQVEIHPAAKIGKGLFIDHGSGVVIGETTEIGAGSVVVLDVPRDSTVVGNPGRPVLIEGQKVGIPDIDYRHLPDPVAEAVKCLVARIVEMEKELDELRPEHAGKRRAAVAETRKKLHDLLQFEDGLGI